MNWLLILYVSVGFGTAATGGPLSIEGFTTKAACEAQAKSLRDQLGSKADWHLCAEVKKS